MTHPDTLHTRAHLLFMKLKETLIELEAIGMRPCVTTHGNGMLDSFEIKSAHPTTPAVEEIRARKMHSS